MYERTRRSIVDDLNSISGTIEIGPILCNYSGIVDRVEDLAQTLDDYLDGSQVLELTRELVKTLITDLGPDSVRLDLDEEVIVPVRVPCERSTPEHFHLGDRRDSKRDWSARIETHSVIVVY